MDLKFGRHSTKRPVTALAKNGRRCCSTCGLVIPEGTPIVTTAPKVTDPNTYNMHICPLCVKKFAENDSMQRWWDKFDKKEKEEMFQQRAEHCFIDGL
jgi:hypothetical protein